MSTQNFDDIKQILDRALESSKGIRVTCETAAEAHRLRHRCNSFRVKDRETNTELYQMGDPLHGVSLYDGLVLTMEGTEIYIRPRGEFKIEEL